MLSRFKTKELIETNSMKQFSTSIVFFVVLILVGFEYNTYGQNLVPNGGFETYSSCPNADGQLNFATGWSSAKGTCDLYNTCNNGTFGVPNNQVGYQQAHSGNGYAGFFAAQGFSETREYLQVQLNDTLEQGVAYCVQFYVCLADKLDGFNEYIFDMAVNNLGCFASTNFYAPQPNNFDHISVTPQVVNDPAQQLLNDTANWVLVEGQFIANGGEQYLLIGSFNDNAGQDTTALDFWQSMLWSYYLIDDVQLRNCSCPEIFTGALTMPLGCHNDTNGSITASAFGGVPPYSYNLFLGGNSIQSFPATNNPVSFNNLSAGSYTLHIIDSNLCETDTIIVLTNPELITANATIIHATCEQNNGSISVTAFGGSGALTYNWTPNDVANANLYTIPAGSYTLHISDTNGCSLDTIFHVNTTLNPIAAISINPGLPGSVNTAISFTDNSIPNTGTIEEYDWSFSNGIESTLPQVTIVFSEAGVYELLYIVGNSVGCFDTLFVEIPLSGKLTIPNVVTTNVDGINDVFYLDGLQNFKQVSVTILNRWGAVIFEDEDYENDWNPHGFSEGVYFYKIEVTPFSGETEMLTGFIEIIK